jgi:hypothetical protein
MTIVLSGTFRLIQQVAALLRGRRGVTVTGLFWIGENEELREMEEAEKWVWLTIDVGEGRSWSRNPYVARRHHAAALARNEGAFEIFSLSGL